MKLEQFVYDWFFIIIFPATCKKLEVALFSTKAKFITLPPIGDQEFPSWETEAKPHGEKKEIHPKLH